MSANVLLAEAADAPVGCTGLTFLPYLSGERTPHADANARGVFAGLHLGHGRGHLARAVMEGITFALRDSWDLIRGTGTEPDHAVMVGGASRSGSWRQMMADVLQVPVVTVGEIGAAYGAAMLAAVGAGYFDSAASVAGTWQSARTSVGPQRDRAPAYEAAYGRYRRLYPRLRAYFSEAAGADEPSGA